jgi:molecular chaperone DnaJ
MSNPYEVLGVRENASQEEIKQAYRDLVKKYHPDKFKDNPLSDLADDKLKEINEAYDTLTKGSTSGGANSGAYSNPFSGGGFNPNGRGEGNFDPFQRGYNQNDGYRQDGGCGNDLCRICSCVMCTDCLCNSCC